MDKVVDSWARYKQTIDKKNKQIAAKYNAKIAESRRNWDNRKWWQKLFQIDINWEEAMLEVQKSEAKLEPTFEDYLNWEADRQGNKGNEKSKD